MSAAGRRLRGIVMLEDRIIGNEYRAGGTGEEGPRRPVDRRWLAANKATGRERRAVRAYGPSEVLAKEGKRGGGRKLSPRPFGEICIASFSYHGVLRALLHRPYGRRSADVSGRRNLPVR